MKKSFKVIVLGEASKKKMEMQLLWRLLEEIVIFMEIMEILSRNHNVNSHYETLLF